MQSGGHGTPDLTVREMEAFGFIADAIERHGRPPSLSTLQRALRLSAKSQAARLVATLERKRLIQRSGQPIKGSCFASIEIRRGAQ